MWQMLVLIRSVKFDTNGSNFVFASGLTNPTGLAFDKNGNLYVSDGDFNSNIVKIDPSGNVSVFAESLSGGDFGIAVDSSGNVYVASLLHSRIYKYDPSGNGTLFAISGLGSLYGLAIDAGGDVYAASESGAIEKFDPSGNGTNFASGLSSLAGIALDSSGNLYAGVSNNGGQIEEFDPAGNELLFASTGLNSPQFLAVQVPEPSAWVLVALGVGFVLGRHKTRSTL